MCDQQPPSDLTNNHCIDPEAFLRLLHEPGDVFEIRSIDCPERLGGTFTSTAAGWFNDSAKAAQAVAKVEQVEPPAVYVTVNPCEPALLGRCANRVQPKARATTKDPDIVWRRWLFVDIDAKRPAGVSATDAELAEAQALADGIRQTLVAEGWPEPLLGASGNGAYLFWRVDLPNDDRTADLVKRVLQAMAGRFDTDGAEVDCSTFNASRICKLLGTVARKGDALVGVDGVEDRPHRRSWFVMPDGPLSVVASEQLETLAAQVAEPESPRATDGRPASGDAFGRCCKYLAKMAPAVSGELGSRKLYRAACVALHDFGLSGDEAAQAIEQAYNPRCVPPWEAAGVRRAIDKARREGGPSKRFGSASVDPEKLPPAARGSDDAGPIRPRLLCMADVEPRPIRWLWQNRIPLGRLSLLVGMPGCGKSYLSCDMAARVSTGTPWPDGSPCDRGSVLFITAEDDPHDTIRPRLDAHRADVSRVHLLTGSVVREPDGQESEMMFSLQDVATLEAAVDAVPDCRLIVVDPIGSFLGGRTDAHRDNEVRGVLAPVAMAAERSGAAVLIVAHRRKSNGGSADDMALGSRAFTGLARAVWHLSRDPDDAPRRLWLPGKNNLAAEPDGLAFRILGDPASVHWEPEALSMSADDALSRERAGDDGERSAGDEAVAWLEQYLDECGRPAKEIKADARKDGIAARTLDRAAAKLGVVKEPGGFGEPWHWRIPSADPDSLAKSCQSRQGENPGETADTMARLDGGPDGSAAPAPSVEPDPADPPVRRSGVI